MTPRERFLATMTFGTPDRPASGDYFYYDSTRARWEREGLPAGADLNAYFEMDFDPFRWQVPVNTGIAPAFAKETLEETADYRLLRTAAGEVVKIRRDTPPPAMPQWVRYPLATRAEWDAFKTRLDPETPGRLPTEWIPYTGPRETPLGLWVGGTYGVLRSWWGVEAISLLFYDDPALIEEMMDYLTHLSLRLLERVLAAGVRPDWVMFWEDMAYKTGSLLAPALYRRYCLPFYRAMMAKIQAAGVPVVMLDSDGDIHELIPLWRDCGITVMHPMEVAAGMDVIAARREYGRGLAFFGGIDKRALAGTRADIRAEVLPKLHACWEDGGFIPACDHAIPPDVSFDNYRYYRDLVQREAARLFG